MPSKTRINITPGYRSGTDMVSEAYLNVQLEVYASPLDNLDYTVEGIAEYTLRFLPDTNEIALIKGDEILYSEEVI